MRPNGFLRYTVYVTLCILLLAIFMFTPIRDKFYELFLPGDPAVTTGAFREFCVAMDRGEALKNALDEFCKTVMGQR